MLQVARLAPLELGESRDLVAAFFKSRLNPDGGFQDRTGESDLYYTVFGLEGLVALQEEIPARHVAPYLEAFDDGSGLDFVHLACLARCWATVASNLTAVPPADAILAHLETYRTPDGGYAQGRCAERGNAYAAFLALGTYQDLGRPLPDPHGLLASVAGLRSGDMAYSNQPGDARGTTTVTAAAVMLLRALGGAPDPHLGVWLLDRCQSNGGFLASAAAPIPDLLSTATGLHALAALDVPIAGLREACLDFVDSLWTNRGGFYGSWVDDDIDCEYTYYGLLALGHLRVGAPA